MKFYWEVALCAVLVGTAFYAHGESRIHQYEEQALNPSQYVLAHLVEEETAWAPPGPELRTQLEAVRDKTRIPPVNAKMDRIWKAIPELNGIEIDVDKSYEAAVQAQGKSFALVYRQILPSVTLRDLPPAPIYRGNPGKKQMALMINVAWGEEYLPKMIQTLKENQANATFFLDGSWVTRHPAEAKKLMDEGFEIGNHAFHHPDMSKLSQAKQKEEIVSTNDAIFQATGVRSTLFAPPSGSFNQTTVNTAAEIGLKTILWTADTIDWQRPAPDTIIKRIVSKACGGGLVLMHPTAPTAQALPELIHRLQDKGYKLVSVSTLLNPTRDPIP